MSASLSTRVKSQRGMNTLSKLPFGSSPWVTAKKKLSGSKALSAGSVGGAVSVLQRISGVVNAAHHHLDGPASCIRAMAICAGHPRAHHP